MIARNVRGKRPLLSLTDAFAYALAASRGSIMLTGDGELRALARAERVIFHGVLWVLDSLFDGEFVEATALVSGLEAIGAHPRCRLPRGDIQGRLERYKRGFVRNSKDYVGSVYGAENSQPTSPHEEMTTHGIVQRGMRKSHSAPVRCGPKNCVGAGRPLRSAQARALARQPAGRLASAERCDRGLLPADRVGGARQETVRRLPVGSALAREPLPRLRGDGLRGGLHARRPADRRLGPAAQAGSQTTPAGHIGRQGDNERRCHGAAEHGGR